MKYNIYLKEHNVDSKIIPIFKGPILQKKEILKKKYKDIDLLNIIKTYLGNKGSISKNGGSYNYEVSSYKDCYAFIFDFFNKYPIPEESLKSKNYKI